MVGLPEPTDPTLDAAAVAFRDRAACEPDRPYLGMSGIGHPCLRKHWYDFRWCSVQDWDAATLFRFDDGHRSEDIQADRLRLVAGVELKTVDPATGQQIGFADHAGHFRGHADGIITGLLQAPATPHIWEHKCVNEAKFQKLETAKTKLGEKQALAAWDSTYHVQAQLYMHYSGLKRHYLTCATPGTRDVTSCRTNYDPDVAATYITRAAQVIQAATPPGRVSDAPDYWLCRWCHHSGLCHGERVARVSCRTCIHSTPAENAMWKCDRLEVSLSVDVQRKSGLDETACPHHLFIPDLVPFAEQVDAGEDWVEYDYQGSRFANGPGDQQNTSLDIQRAGTLVMDEVVDAVKKHSAGG